MDLESIVTQIKKFRDERDWAQFHNAKDMAAALVIEATELQEIFLWKNGPEVDEVLKNKRTEIEDEVADIAVYLFEFADSQGIDLQKAIEAKLAKNAAKYPVEKARGSSAKYTDL